jgi:hypothetical protein
MWPTEGREEGGVKPGEGVGSGEVTSTKAMRKFLGFKIAYSWQAIHLLALPGRLLAHLISASRLILALPGLYIIWKLNCDKKSVHCA